MPRPPLMADEIWNRSRNGNLYTIRHDGTLVVICKRWDGRYVVMTRNPERGTLHWPRSFESPSDVKRYAEREVLDLWDEDAPQPPEPYPRLPFDLR